MHTRIPHTIKISFLAAAVVTLSGCASSPQPSVIGETLVDAGRTTADASIRAYQKTIEVLGFNLEDDAEFDEVDMALMDIEKSAANRLIIPAAADVEAPPSGAPAIATIPAIDPTNIPVATIDYNHVVGPNETMWTIAKLTTGNANNWRILAEINQLDLNTPMSIGQEILVPADLVLPQIVALAANDNDVVNPTGGAIAEGTDGPTLAQAAPLNLSADPFAVADDSEAARLELDNIRPIAQSVLESDPTNPASSDALTLGANDDTMVEDSTQTEELVADAESTAPDTILDPSSGAVALKADVGETLWDMAKRTTGDATNWEAIAEQNGFTEQDIGRIRYGQTIYVPLEMAKTELGGENIVIASTVPAADDTDADAVATDQLVAQTATTPAAPAPNSDAEAIDASADLMADANGILDETKEIKIVEAAYQPDNAESLLDDQPIAEGATGQVIMVSGTYYPKAVYNEADFSSSLLMRVSPGTEMTVSRAMGPWFEVQTEHGIGYMHSRDIK